MGKVVLRVIRGVDWLSSKFMVQKLGYFKTKISSVRAFRWFIAYANSMCARQVITVQNLCCAWL